MNATPKSLNFILFILTLAVFACNNPEIVKTNPVVTDTVVRSLTVDQTKALQPKFPDFYPKSYILGQDTVFMRVVSNSPHLEKAWMIYYDYDDRKWATITWQGYGDKNAVIGDTVFTRKNGIVNGSSSDDAPQFYFAFSEDSGRTWKPHHISEAVYFCKEQHQYSTVLISEPFLKETHRPYLGVIVQWRKVTPATTTSSTIASMNFDFYCELTRDLRKR
jgi:hypothetical protein